MTQKFAIIVFVSHIRLSSIMPPACFQGGMVTHPRNFGYTAARELGCLVGSTGGRARGVKGFDL
jgi:hypothetical protein